MWKIDFLLPAGALVDEEFVSLRQIENFTWRLQSSPELHDDLVALIGNLKQELHDRSPQFAQTRYHGAPLFALHEVGRAEVTGAERNEVRIRRERRRFDEYTLGDVPLVEVLDYRPRSAESDWQSAVAEWFYDPGCARVIVDDRGALSDEVVPGEITGIEASPTFERIRFRVAAPRDAIVLVRMSWFPKWRAFADGPSGPHLPIIAQPDGHPSRRRGGTPLRDARVRTPC